MWQDKILYWAWNGERSPEDKNPPTKKRIVYKKVDGGGPYLNGLNKGSRIAYKVAVGVWDDNQYTSLAD